jgi:hypothetical protein
MQRSKRLTLCRILQARDGGLFDLKENRVGRCYPLPVAMLDCGTTFSIVEGHRKLHCEIGVNAADINSERP